MFKRWVIAAALCVAFASTAAAQIGEINGLKLLAAYGDAKAQYHLGLRYDGGVGVPSDRAEAAKWFRRAADQGLKYAQWSLGISYMWGSGVPQDYVQAHMWANLAAAQDYYPAQELRAQLEQVMTREQIAAAERLAREWTPNGNPSKAVMNTR